MKTKACNNITHGWAKLKSVILCMHNKYKIRRQTPSKGEVKRKLSKGKGSQAMLTEKYSLYDVNTKNKECKE